MIGYYLNCIIPNYILLIIQMYKEKVKHAD